jgi:hypothetical protein
MKARSLAISAAVTAMVLITLIPVFVVIWRGLVQVRALLG